MKGLIIFLVLTLISLLTACSDNSVTRIRGELPTNSNTSASQPTQDDRSVLVDFLDALNNHQIAETMYLFNDEAILTMVDQINFGTTLPENDSPYTYRGKAEIEGWLEYQAGAIIRIVPGVYRESDNSITLEAVFYYTNQVCNIRVDAQTQGGRFNSLTYYIQKVNHLTSDD